MKVWYLYNSGVAVRTAGRLLVFDYWKNRTLPGGIPALARQEGCPVTVFVSHRHYDHYNPEIFAWRQALPDVTYVLADDVPPQPGCVTVPPDAALELPGCAVRTFRSTDEGVAFLVDADGASVFHAGDLHWWHWDGEPDEDNRRMAAAYQAEIQKLAAFRPDLAFVPVDGRQGDAFALGIDYFASRVDCPRLVPIHFSSDESVLRRLTARNPDYADRLCILTETRPFASWP